MHKNTIDFTFYDVTLRAIAIQRIMIKFNDGQ